MATPSEEPSAAEEPAKGERSPGSPDSESATPLGRNATDRLLLDTHVLIWWRATPAKIRAEARNAISQAAVVFVSVASAWEAAIKIALGRLSLPESMEAGVVASDFEKLSITFAHTELIASCPITTATRSTGC